MQIPARRQVVAGAAVLTGVAGAVTALVLPSADAEGVRVPEFGPPASVPFRPELATPLPVEAAVPPRDSGTGSRRGGRRVPIHPGHTLTAAGQPPRPTGTGPYPHRNSGRSRTAAGGPTPTVRSNGERAAGKEGAGTKRAGGEKKGKGEKKGGGKKGG